jgi:hypothetical protein
MILKRLILLGALILGCANGASETPSRGGSFTGLTTFTSPSGREVFASPNCTHFFTKENVSDWTPAKIDVEALKGNVQHFLGIQWTAPKCEETENPIELFQYNDRGSQYKWSQFPKKTSGIYRYLDKDGVCIYIGKAKNLRTRMGQHARNNKQAIDKFLCTHSMHRTQQGTHGTNIGAHKITCEYITVQSFKDQWEVYLINRKVDSVTAELRTKKYTYHYMEAWALWVHMSCSALNAMPKYNIKRDWRPYALHKTTGKHAGKKHRRHKKPLHDMTKGAEATVLKPYTGDVSLLAQADQHAEAVAESIEQDGYADIPGYDSDCEIFRDELKMQTIMEAASDVIWGQADPRWHKVEEDIVTKMAEYRENEEKIEAGWYRTSRGKWIRPPSGPTADEEIHARKTQQVDIPSDVEIHLWSRESNRQPMQRSSSLDSSQGTKSAKRSLSEEFANTLKSKADSRFKPPFARKWSSTGNINRSPLESAQAQDLVWRLTRDPLPGSPPRKKRRTKKECPPPTKRLR